MIAMRLNYFHCLFVFFSRIQLGNILIYFIEIAVMPIRI